MHSIWTSIKTCQQPLETHKPTGRCVTPTHVPVSAHTVYILVLSCLLPGSRGPARAGFLGRPCSPRGPASRAPLPSGPERVVHAHCSHLAGPVLAPSLGENFPLQS